MNKKTFITTIFCTFLIIFISTSVFANRTKNNTIENLNAALKGETNASHKYELFAQKAYFEGYKQVAKLFRAISMSESIHRNNHKAVILSLGAKPDIISYESVTVKSTKENLKEPIIGEKHEKLFMYPNFIKQANIENKTNAVKTFSDAQKAETQHETLLKDALKNLGKNKTANYCVSRITGATYSINVNQKCPMGKYDGLDEYILVK